MPPRRRTADLQRPLSEQLAQTVTAIESRRLQEGLPLLASTSGTRTAQHSDTEDLSEPDDFGNDSSLLESPTKEMSAEEDERLNRESSMQLEEDLERERSKSRSFSESPSKHSELVMSDDEVGQSMEPEDHTTPPPKTRKKRVTKKDTTANKTPSRRNPPRKGRRECFHLTNIIQVLTTPPATPSRIVEESTPSAGDEDEGEETETRADTTQKTWGYEESWQNYPLEFSTNSAKAGTSKPASKETKRKDQTQPETPANTTPFAERLTTVLSTAAAKVFDGVRFYSFMFSDVIKWIAVSLLISCIIWFMGSGPFETAFQTVVTRPATSFMEWRHSFTRSTTLPPESAEELIKRLMKLEKELGWVDTKVKSHDGQFESIIGQIGDLQSNAASYSRQMKDKVADLEKTIAEHYKSSKKLTEGQRLHLVKLEATLEATNKRVKDFETRLRAMEQGYDQIRKQLPSHIALRQDHRGKVTLRPEFLTALLDELRAHDIHPGVGKARGAIGTPLTQTWADWLRQNEQNLKGLISDESDSKYEKMARDGLIVNKDTVIRLLKDTSEKTMPELEKKIAASIEAAQKKLRRPTPSSNANTVLQHNYEVLAASPDYAAWATGSRIDPYVTSPTFLNMGWGARMYHKFIGLEHPPTTPGNVLISGGELGNCWAFAGKAGQIGIVLPMAIFPTDLTIEHVSYGQAIDKTSAPKEIEFWAEVRNQTLRNRLNTVANTVIKTPVIQPVDNSISRAYVRIASFQYNFSETGTARQVFSIPMQLREVLGDGNGIEKVVFRINGNYGNDLYTCLYRFRVHGIPDSADVQPGPGGPQVGGQDGSSKAYGFGKR